MLLRAAVLLALLVLCGACAGSSDRPRRGSEPEDDLWARTVAPYLEARLWTDREAYDAGHYLMVPLHAAYLLDKPHWRRDLEAHFRRFSADAASLATDRLTRLQYLYLTSRFLVLSRRAGGYEGTGGAELESLVRREVVRFWSAEPAWQWGREPFAGGVRERLEWKLANRTVARSYYRAVIDEELYLMALAADLRVLGGDEAAQAAVDEILAAALEVFDREVVPQPGGGWLFQPGVWTDHPDFAYAGREEKVPDMAPSPVPGIASDSSHSHRFPLWLASLAGAFPVGSLEAERFESLRRGLEIQFVERVLAAPAPGFPSYRATNFMDGRNGVFRWGYATQGAQDGYGPFELSGTLLLGWWGFLGTSRVARVFDDLSARFPLPTPVVTLYVGPNTTRERHPLVADPASFTNGFRELLVRLAADLAAASSP